MNNKFDFDNWVNGGIYVKVCNSVEQEDFLDKLWKHLDLYLCGFHYRNDRSYVIMTNEDKPRYYYFSGESILFPTRYSFTSQPPFTTSKVYEWKDYMNNYMHNLSDEGRENYNKTIDELYKDTGVKVFDFCSHCKIEPTTFYKDYFKVGKAYNVNGEDCILIDIDSDTLYFFSLDKPMFTVSLVEYLNKIYTIYTMGAIRPIKELKSESRLPKEML